MSRIVNITLLLILSALPAVAQKQSPVETSSGIARPTTQRRIPVTKANLRELVETMSADEIAVVMNKADMDDALAQTIAARALETGRHVAKDEKRAAELYRKAAEQGNALAQACLGGLYKDGKVVTKDVFAAVAWYRRSAEQGHVDGQVGLACVYFWGDAEISKNSAEAAKWFIKAADQGSTIAQTNLAWLYSIGDGVPQSHATAIRLYESVAAKGQPLGYSNLAEMYRDGEGVERNFPKALELFKKAAELGDAASMREVGLIFLDGRGVKRNRASARQWLIRASESGHLLAAPDLCNLSYFGSDDSENTLDTTLFWCSVASNQSPDAAKKQKRLLRMFSPEQAEAIKQKATAFVTEHLTGEEEAN
jgi:TPR repeat protein